MTMRRSKQTLRKPLAYRSSADWIAYFRSNGERLREIAWDEGAQFTPAEKAAVIRSIQIFQLGESGQGKHFVRLAEEHGRRIGDDNYAAAVELFLAEEHRHARELGRVLDLAGAPRLSSQWTDNIFRRLRHLGGLELKIAALVNAEVLAQVYYAALRRATESTLLRRLCTQILADEAAHVRFQSERLALLRHGRSRLGLRLRRICERMLFAVTCLVVWRGHYRVFRAAHFTFRSFWRRAHSYSNNSLRSRDPRCYLQIPTPNQAADASPAPWQGVYS
jgi:hypothetical protein